MPLVDGLVERDQTGKGVREALAFCPSHGGLGYGSVRLVRWINDIASYTHGTLSIILK